ncbi:Dual specificity phosphatase, catalytic domain containing protein [Musa troglodytarum]|uniref:protein-tyrosine-phosphatase n=1 Tax=Musa troglodytarum TaxID=320322 RepID=A0A9E7FL66_9LILI|nr:Dual specificity phosphatase, catalytic domain containing protein [Musa troglodytarum]
MKAAPSIGRAGFVARKRNQARSASLLFHREREREGARVGRSPAMPYLVRDRLFFGDITAAAEVLKNGSPEITHVLSLLSSASISFFSDWRSEISIPTEEIRKVFAGADGSPRKSLAPGKLVCSLERAGPELKLVRMAVPLRDTEDENLLDHLDVCLDFVDQGRKEGGVLVHCFAGVSRSAAVIIAYLMRTEHKSMEDALESLREICESVSPNDGFLDQLSLFEEMGFKVDTENPIYKRFRLKVKFGLDIRSFYGLFIVTLSKAPNWDKIDDRSFFYNCLFAGLASISHMDDGVQLDQEALLGHSYKQGEKIDGSIFGADPGLPLESNSSEEVRKGNQHTTAYRCKKCRRIVALQGNVVSHVPGENETFFDWQKRKSGNWSNRFQEQECSSLFVEPLKWMTSVEDGALEGKLSCIKCDARLGYFNWSGIQCSCGSWITPAFQIHKSKVDISMV